jgi:hypothetical protein
MKIQSTFAQAALCVLVTVSTTAADDSAKPAPPSPAAPSSPVAVKSPVGTDRPAPAAPASAARLPKSLAEEKATEEALRAHVRPAARLMATPPPAARAEVKPPAPDAHSVWVPGHWAPEAGEWKWTAGQWSTPATPVSVWIEAKYDAKTKQWSPGYWQPDRPDSYLNETDERKAER